jgi:hypothetical protein
MPSYVPVSFGIDSVYTAPSGNLVALGLIPFASDPLNPQPSIPMVGLLRANPFSPGANPLGWAKVFANMGPGDAARLMTAHGTVNQNSTAVYQWAMQGGPYPSSLQGSVSAQGIGNGPTLQQYLSSGDPVYMFAGTQTPSGLSAAYNMPGSGLPGGWWLYRGPGDATYPPLGSAAGTLASDATDWAWAQQMLPTWTAGKTSYQQLNPLQFLPQGSTLSQVGATPSSSGLIWLAVAAALGYAIYELA